MSLQQLISQTKQDLVARFHDLILSVSYPLENLTLQTKAIMLEPKEVHL